VATTIESKAQIVSKHYGVGRMIPVIQQLQRQCDIDASNILEQFEVCFTSMLSLSLAR
jgi:hypothetical protein